MIWMKSFEQKIINALKGIGFSTMSINVPFFGDPEEAPMVTIEGYFDPKASFKFEEAEGVTACPDIIESLSDYFQGVVKYTPKRVLKSGNRTIVFWRDGTKTVVKRAEDEPDNDYTAYTAALAKKIYGSNNAVKRIIASLETQKKGCDKNEEARR